MSTKRRCAVALGALICFSSVATELAGGATPGSESGSGEAPTADGFEQILKQQGGRYTKHGWNHYGPGYFELDAETGVVMLLYLDLAYEQAKSEGRLRNLGELQQAIRYGAVQRLRPKFMTVATMFLGLVPIMWSTGTGADVMKRIAAPMIGGIFTSFILELLVYPVIYEIWKWHFEVKKAITDS